MSSIKLFLLSVPLLVSHHAICAQIESASLPEPSDCLKAIDCFCSEDFGIENLKASTNITDVRLLRDDREWESEEISYLVGIYPNVTNLEIYAPCVIEESLPDGCWPMLDLSPLSELRHLRGLTLHCRGELQHLDAVLSRSGLMFEIVNYMGPFSVVATNAQGRGKSPYREVEVDFESCFRGGRVECHQKVSPGSLYFESPYRDVLFENHSPWPARVMRLPDGCQSARFDGVFDFGEAEGSNDLECFEWHCDMVLPKGVANSLNAGKFPNLRFVYIDCVCAEREKFDMARLVGGIKRFVYLRLYNCTVINLDKLRGHCLGMIMHVFSYVPDSCTWECVLEQYGMKAADIEGTDRSNEALGAEGKVPSERQSQREKAEKEGRGLVRRTKPG